MSDLERRVRELEDRLSRLTNPSEAWLRKMADAEDQAGSVSAGDQCDVNADLESGFGELQRKLDAGEAIVSTSGKVLVKKRPAVNPCRKCGKSPRVVGPIHREDEVFLATEISCCGETAVGLGRDETVECWNKRNPAPEPEPAEQPLPEFATGTGAEPPLGTTAEQREWWIAVWKNTGRGFAFESKEAADREASINPDCVKIIHVVRVPTAVERMAVVLRPGGWLSHYSLDAFFGPAES